MKFFKEPTENIIKTINCDCGAKLYIEEGDIKRCTEKCFEAVYHYYHNPVKYDSKLGCYQVNTSPRFIPTQIQCELEYINCPLCGERHILRKIPLDPVVEHHYN